MLWLDIKYCNLLSSKLEKFKVISQTPYAARFRCPLCGDSKKNPNKCRGNLYVSSSKLYFKCHNCGAPNTASSFIKMVDQTLYKEYRLEKFRESGNTHYEEIKEDDDPIGAFPFADVSGSITRCDNINNTKVIEFLEKRKIPKNKYDRIFHIDNFKKLEEFFPQYKDKLPKEERILFPFYEVGKISGVNARSITGKQYTTLTFIDDVLPFGMERCNRLKQIYIVEGPIDSLFLDNAIAVCCSDLTRIPELIKKDQCTLVYDNQPRNIAIVNQIKKAADAGFKMVVWPENILEKDINDMILSGYDVKDIINKNTYSGLLLKVKLGRWIKI